MGCGGAGARGTPYFGVNGRSCGSFGPGFAAGPGRGTDDPDHTAGSTDAAAGLELAAAEVSGGTPPEIHGEARQSDTSAICAMGTPISLPWFPSNRLSCKVALHACMFSWFMVCQPLPLSAMAQFLVFSAHSASGARGRTRAVGGDA